jgi:hypothetical protein
MKTPNRAGGSLPASTSALPVRRKVVERLAGGEQDPPDAGGVAVGEQLDEGAAGVVATSVDVV